MCLLDSHRVTGFSALLLSLLGGGLASAGSIGNLVFLDTDGDGIYEPGSGEIGVSAVTVRLYSAGADHAVGGGDDVLIGLTSTNGAGVYAFTGLAADTYYVVFVAPAGRIFTLPNQGADDTVDSDAGADGFTGAITLASGQDRTDVDCGLALPASVGDLVFVDADADGIRDAGDVGLPGITVTLLDPGPNGLVGDGDDVPVNTTTTDANGQYRFTDLLRGDYYIHVDLSGDLIFSPQDQGSDDTRDSDVDPVTRNSAIFTLTVGQTDLTRDCGVYTQGRIAGRVFHDLDGDGIQDSGDGALSAAATVRLLSPGPDGDPGTADDVQVGSDQSTTSAYSFSPLDPGRYFVQVIPPGGSGLAFVPRNRGGNDAFDSDVNPATGLTDLILLNSGEEITTVDAGLAIYSSIGDFAFLDANANGLQDGGEAGAPRVLVLLYATGADGAVGGRDDTLLGTTVTDAGGAYEFKVVAGHYYLVFVPPAGRAFTSLDQGSDDALDSDADPATGQTVAFLVAEGSTDHTWDAGLVIDTDSDGTPDAEDGCPGDPGKTEPGACGCGVPDADGDGDGILDCQDNCPFVWNPSQADADGDGLGDACEAAAAAPGTPSPAANPPPVNPPRDAGSRPGGAGESGGSSGATGQLPVGLPVCGACGALSLTGYAASAGGYGAFLAWRRIRRRG